jgi:hypothetical protein
MKSFRFTWLVGITASVAFGNIGCASECVMTNSNGFPSYDPTCGTTDGETGPGESEIVPDFSLTDVNINSEREGESVSPRDYEGEVSAWYFGHAT